MIIATVAAARDLAGAAVMARSVKEQMPGTKVVVGIIEEAMPAGALQVPYFDEVVLLGNVLRYPNLSKFFFQYDEEEAKNACKAPLMNYIYDRYPHEALFVYLDPNTRVYSPISELTTITKDHPIVITGHHTNADYMDWEWRSAHGKTGVYSSGLLALKRHPEAKRFVLWWAKISERHASNEYAYLDLAPVYFDDVYTLRHSGYGIEQRNLIERWNIAHTLLGGWTVNGSPLRTIHYSKEFPAAMSWIDESKGQLYSKLYEQYMHELVEAVQPATSSDWSYSHFSSGERISRAAKQSFRLNYYDNPAVDNPFTLSNAFFHSEPAESWSADDIALPYEEVNRMRRTKRAKAVRMVRAGRNRNKPRKTRSPYRRIR